MMYRDMKIQNINRDIKNTGQNNQRKLVVFTRKYLVP